VFFTPSQSTLANNGFLMYDKKYTKGIGEPYFPERSRRTLHTGNVYFTPPCIYEFIPVYLNIF